MENSINFKQLFVYYCQRWYFLASAVVLGLIGGRIYSVVQTPMFESSAQVVVLSRPASSGSNVDVIMGNYEQIVTSRRIANAVADQLHDESGIDASYISSVLSVSHAKNSEILDIKTQTDNAERSRLIAETTVVAFSDTIQELYQIESENIQTIGAPMAAARPYNVHHLMSMAIGAAIGLFVTAVVLFMIFDSRVANGQDKERKGGRKSKLEKLAEQAQTNELEARIAEAEARIQAVSFARIESEAKKISAEALREESRARLVTAQSETISAEIENLKVKQAKLESEKAFKESAACANIDVSAAKQKAKIAAAIAKREAKDAATTAKREAKVAVIAAKQEAKIIADARLEIAKNRAANQISASREEVVTPAAPVTIAPDTATYNSVQIKAPGWSRQ